MSKIIEEIKQYQWKKGEHFGEVVEVKEITTDFTYFTDGSRIFTDILPEFMEEVHDGILPFPGAVQPGTHINTGHVSTDTIEKIIPSDEVAKSDVYPMVTLIEKLSNKNHEDIHIKICINIPTPDVINMLVENSDDCKEKLLELVSSSAVKQIEINKLQKYIKTEIDDFIIKYYG